VGCWGVSVRFGGGFYDHAEQPMCRRRRGGIGDGGAGFVWGVGVRVRCLTAGEDTGGTFAVGAGDAVLAGEFGVFVVAQDVGEWGDANGVMSAED